MRRLFFITFVAILPAVSCTERKQTVQELTSSSRINLLTDSINVLIDSASQCYDLALKDRRNGVRREDVFLKYNVRCSVMQSDINRLLDSLSLEFIRGHKTKKEYDSLIFSKFDFLEVQKKADELAGFGVVFHFDK